MGLKLVTGPEPEEPVSVDEVKDHARITLDAEDALISSKIIGWRRELENWLGRALITQTWQLFLHEFPSGTEIKVPLPPLQSVASIKYTDSNGDEDTFLAANYYVDTISTPGVIVLNSGKSWPSTLLRPRNGVEIEFKAGYGDKATDVPQDIREGLKMLIAAALENREATLPVLLRENQLLAGLLWPYNANPLFA